MRAPTAEEETEMDLGEPKEIVEVELPAFPEEAPASEPAPTREDEPVPAGR